MPVMMLTAHGSERVAVAAMKAGAFDYLPKPFDPDELVLAVRRGPSRRASCGSRTRGSARKPRSAGPSSPRARRSARARHGDPRRAQGRHRAPHRRERRRQRRARGDAPRAFEARRQAARSVQRRGHPERARRGGALRAHQRAPSPARKRRGSATSSRPTRARSSSTRSASCRSPSKPRSCARSSRARCSRSAGAPRTSTCVWSSPRTAISLPRRKRAVPRRPLLPAQRRPDPRAAASRAARGHRAARARVRAHVRRSLRHGAGRRRAGARRGVQGPHAGPATCASSRTPWRASSRSRPTTGSRSPSGVRSTRGGTPSTHAPLALERSGSEPSAPRARRGLRAIDHRAPSSTRRTRTRARPRAASGVSRPALIEKLHKYGLIGRS